MNVQIKTKTLKSTIYNNFKTDEVLRRKRDKTCTTPTLKIQNTDERD